MAALFYTNHKMNDVQLMFKEWLALYKNIKQNGKKAVPPQRAVPAIEIDTDLANAQYENQNELEKQESLDIGNHLQNQMIMTNDYDPDLGEPNNNNVHIVVEEDLYNQLDKDSSKEESPENDGSSEGDSDDDKNEDEKQDIYVKNFLKDLQKVGPYSK